jgi:hypothetical protein
MLFAMKPTARILLLSVLVLTLAAPVLHAQSGELTGGMGGAADPVAQAATAYSRGMQSKRQAEAETDPQKKAKLYGKAKDELTKSVRLQRNFDALLALGQVYLALGKKPFALDACTGAQAMKPADEAAKACIEAARKETKG